MTHGMEGGLPCSWFFDITSICRDMRSPIEAGKGPAAPAGRQAGARLMSWKQQAGASRCCQWQAPTRDAVLMQNEVLELGQVPDRVWKDACTHPATTHTMTTTSVAMRQQHQTRAAAAHAAQPATPFRCLQAATLHLLLPWPLLPRGGGYL